MPARSPEQLHELLSTGFNAADVDALVELYEDDAILVLPPEGQAVHGKEAIRQAVVAMLAMRPSAEFHVVGKVQRDGLALTHGRWRLEGTDPAGERVALSGRGTMVSRRQPDSRWLIALDNAMSPD